VEIFHGRREHGGEPQGAPAQALGADRAGVHGCRSFTRRACRTSGERQSFRVLPGRRLAAPGQDFPYDGFTPYCRQVHDRPPPCFDLIGSTLAAGKAPQGPMKLGCRPFSQFLLGSEARFTPPGPRSRMLNLMSGTGERCAPCSDELCVLVERRVRCDRATTFAGPVALANTSWRGASRGSFAPAAADRGLDAFPAPPRTARCPLPMPSRPPVSVRSCL